MSDPQQSKFDGWAIVDVLGHQRYVGYVTTEAYGQAVLFRIDVPQLEPRERVTKAPEYSQTDGKYLPIGTTVTEGAVLGYTKLIGSGSIYAITPCTKEAALASLEDSHRRPLLSVSLPANRTLVAGGPPDVEDAYAESDDDDGDFEDEDEPTGVGQE